MYDIVILGSLKRGGSERAGVRLARFFIEKGKKVAIVTSTGPSSSEYDLPEGVDRYSIRKSTQYLKKSEYFSAIMKYRSILKKIKPKTVIVMSVPDCIYLIPSLFGINANVIVSERNDPNHYQGNKILIKIARWFMRFASGYVFQTQDAQNFYKKILHKPSVVIPNMLPLSEIPKASDNASTNKIVTMGRLHVQKNHRLLIDAYEIFSKGQSDFTLHIYGDGPAREDTEKYISGKSCQDSILLHGNKKEVLEEIKDATLFVLSSDFEGMPNALMEAMGMGLLCISTDCPVGGPAVLIRDGYNGFLVPTKDVKCMADKILYVTRDLSNEKAKIIRQNARKTIEQYYSPECIGGKWLDFIESLGGN